MLTEEERDDLEAWRLFRAEFPTSYLDGVKSHLADAMLRLFPAGHDAEITPERLVACGWIETEEYLFMGEDVSYEKFRGVVRLYSRDIHPRLKTMGDVWQLLEHCGSIVKKGDES